MSSIIKRSAATAVGLGLAKNGVGLRLTHRKRLQFPAADSEEVRPQAEQSKTENNKFEEAASEYIEHMKVSEKLSNFLRIKSNSNVLVDGRPDDSDVIDFGKFKSYVSETIERDCNRGEVSYVLGEIGEVIAQSKESDASDSHITVTLTGMNELKEFADNLFDLLKQRSKEINEAADKYISYLKSKKCAGPPKCLTISSDRGGKLSLGAGPPKFLTISGVGDKLSLELFTVLDQRTSDPNCALLRIKPSYVIEKLLEVIQPPAISTSPIEMSNAVTLSGVREVLEFESEVFDKLKSLSKEEMDLIRTKHPEVFVTPNVSVKTSETESIESDSETKAESEPTGSNGKTLEPGYEPERVQFRRTFWV